LVAVLAVRLHLTPDHAVICTVGTHELLVGATLGDVALLHQEDQVGAAYGGEAMRDHERGAPGEQRGHRRLDELLALRVQESEQLIQASMATLLAGRTTFVIAHRLSTIRRAHLILLMEEGHVAERGTHEELMRAHGAYYRMVRRQMESHGQDGDE